jgi:hypothetical protein
LIRLLRQPPKCSGAGLLSLTPRSVVRLLGAVAEHVPRRDLWIAPGTVRKHLENIYEKLGVTSRTAAVAALRTSVL